MDTDCFESIFEKECYIIDILPQKIGKNKAKQYFAFEKYCLERNNLKKIYEKFTEILIKLNCYYDFIVAERTRITINPSPRYLKKRITKCLKNNKHMLYISIPQCKALITLQYDDLYMCVYNQNDKLKTILHILVQTEGLFFRQP